MTAPLLRRTWSPRGQTPIVRVSARRYRKVSVIGALCIGPDRRQVRFYFRLHPEANVDATRATAFLAALGHQLGGPVVVVWDRLLAHRALRVQRFLATHRSIRCEFLPPYAPELNPIEYVWGYLKRNPLANLPFPEVEDLADQARHHGRSLQRRCALLRSFLNHSPLSLRLR